MFRITEQAYQGLEGFMESQMEGNDSAHNQEYVYRVLAAALDIAEHETGVADSKGASAGSRGFLPGDARGACSVKGANGRTLRMSYKKGIEKENKESEGGEK